MNDIVQFYHKLNEMGEIMLETTSKSLKAKINDMIDVCEQPTSLEKFFNLFFISLILLNVLAVMLETDSTINSHFRSFFSAFEVFSISIFSFEYLLRIWSVTVIDKYKHPLWGRLRYMLSPMALIDLFSILPFYLSFLIPFDLRVLRILRLSRILRIFKLGRYSESLRAFGRVFRKKKEDLAILLLIVFIVLCITSTLMFYIESEAQPDKFTSVFSTMWWGIVTLTTIGYGDLYPITPLGRLLGGFIAILGIGVFALPAGILAGSFSEEIKKDECPSSCPHCGKKL
jgi:voltage-gated potassium channel